MNKIKKQSQMKSFARMESVCTFKLG